METETSKKLYLVDGSGFIFRAFHALPPLTSPDGIPVNALYGFCNMLLKLQLETKAEHLAVIFDSGRKSFRNDIYKEYKAHRPPPPDELIPQFSTIREACKAFNVPSIELENFEADDLIATYTHLARDQGMEVVIVSSDKDLMQLISPHVTMLDTLKNKAIGVDEVKEKFGVGPEKVIDVQALAGDASDNVPGIPGIGVKTAAQLINEYGDLENLLGRAHEIKQPKRRESLQNFADAARISLQLVTLKGDIPNLPDLKNFDARPPAEDELRVFLERWGFHALIARLEKLDVISNKKHEKSAKKYELVQNMQALDNWIEKITRAGTVSIDTETTSLNPHQADLVGISLSVTANEACYIPLGHTSPNQDLFEETQTKALKQLPLKSVLEKLAPLLVDPGILKIGQNLKYDMLVLRKYGISMMPIDDTMVMSYNVDGTKHGHGMDELAKLHLNIDTIKYKDVAGKGGFADVSLENACDYAAEDADVTLKLHRILNPLLIKTKSMTFYQLYDRPLISILTDMESTGIKLDVAFLNELSRDFTKRLAVLEEEIYCIAGEQFNVGSPKQLGEILFDKLKLPGGKKGKTGAYGTGADILEDLSIEGYELPEKILQWRQLAKLKSTYTDALVKQINPRTGRVHTSYGMTNVSTGRLSSSDPNLQNIPVRSEDGIKIRKAFITEPGWKIISLDYSQIELRFLAHMANIPELKDAFLHDMDIHAKAASDVFGIPYDRVDSKHRNRAKAINFGIIYGISSFGLARQLKISRKEAAEHIKDYTAQYPGIPDFMEKMKAGARKNGYVETITGRKCYISGIFDQNPARRSFAERQAINAPLQGSNADIIKKAMNAIPKAFKNAGLDARMLLQVHDELIIEAPGKQVEETIAVAREIMQNTVKLDVPLVVDAGVGDNWAEAK
jgi:DNA polymerase-1